MKSSIIILILLLLIFNTRTAFAQSVYTIAITDSGAIACKYRSGDQSFNCVIDTISVDQAKNIRSISALLTTNKDGIALLKIEKFEMTVINKKGSTILKSYSGTMTESMKEELKNIESNSKLYFEGVKSIFSTGEIRSALPLILFVK